MVSSTIILICLLLLQMILTLAMLNPIHDVRKLTHYMNVTTKTHKKTYFFIISAYFSFVVFLGMYIPLQNIHSMIFSQDLDAYDKLMLLSSIEKNYIIAGFSLFLVVVMYGVRALLTYTANLAQLLERNSEPMILHTTSKKFPNNNEILPNVLRVKRSISYEAILCTNELKEQLKIIMKNIDCHYNISALSNVLEASSINL